MSWFSPRDSSEDESYEEPSAFVVNFDRGAPGQVVNVGKYVDIAIHNSWEMACLNRIANDVGQVGFQLLRDGGNAPRVDPWARRLRNPNAEMTTSFLFSETAYWLELCGNAFWLMDKNEEVPNRWAPPIRVPAPSDVVVVSDPKKGVTAYLLVKRDEYRRISSTVRYSPDEVIHFKFTNPLDSIWGMPPQEGIYDVLMTDRHAQEYNKNILKNGLNIPGVLMVEGTLGETDRKRLRRELEERHGGYKNAWVPLILEGMRWEQTAANPKDFEFAQGREANRDAIIAIHSLYPSLLGLTRDVNFATVQLEVKNYWQGTIPARVNRLVGAINAWFALHSPKYEIAADFTKIPMLQEEPKQKSMRLGQEVRDGITTPNEARVELGRPPYKDPAADKLRLESGPPPGQVGRPPADDSPDVEDPDTSDDYESSKSIGGRSRQPAPVIRLSHLVRRGEARG